MEFFSPYDLPVPVTLRGESNLRDHSLSEVHESPIAIPNVPSMGERVRVAQTVLP